MVPDAPKTISRTFSQVGIPPPLFFDEPLDFFPSALREPLRCGNDGGGGALSSSAGGRSQTSTSPSSTTSGSAAGMEIIVPHPEHLIFFPALSSPTLNFLPHLG